MCRNKRIQVRFVTYIPFGYIQPFQIGIDIRKRPVQFFIHNDNASHLSHSFLVYHFYIFLKT